MKKVFTLVLAMTLVVASFAQVEKVSFRSMKHEALPKVSLTGFEERDNVAKPVSDRNMMDNEEIIELSYTTYDWQSNMGPRNFTAVWPDGFAVMCYTQANEADYSDRGTGLAIWDPAVGEWEYTESRVEGVKTGFGSIARYKENGLVVAAHTATDCRIFLVEDFREGNRDFGQGIVMPVESGVDPCWPVVQCSGANLDIVNVLCTNNGASIGEGLGEDPIIYYQYKDGDWTKQYEVIPNLDAEHFVGGGSNITYFMPYEPTKPNRVAFILNNDWSDCKAVISEDNGDTWSERVFWQHPGLLEDFTNTWFMYPRWTSAAFDANDNLCVAYEYNGQTGTAGNGSYYPAIGGIGYWSEVLPKNEMCLGGIGEVGGPFVMDSTYIIQDIYGSAWFWSDANHDPLPEYLGQLEIVDEFGIVQPRDGAGYWPSSDTWKEHGSYNGGVIEFASMFYDKSNNHVYAFWSTIAGDEENMYYDSESLKHYFRVFCNMSPNGGRTWEGTKQVITDFMSSYDEMVYGQVIPFIYNDAEGDYLWYCYQKDGAPGTVVIGGDGDSDPDDNLYCAVKVYLNFMYDDVEESTVEAPTTMKVYPNPANGTFTMELNQESDVNIYNVAGQLVKTYKSVKNLNVNLEAGVYFVQAGNQTQKVVVL